MDKVISRPSRLRAEITPPGDKSISHRAVILNSIAQGKAQVVNLSPGADCLATVACLRALGAEVAGPLGSPPTLTIQGRGKGSLREADDVLDGGNSATTVRLLGGLLAAQPFLSIISGDASLRSRPMRRLVEPLRLMGAQVWGRGGDSLAPLAIKGGNLRGIDYQLPVPSAQIKSAILLAALYAQGDTHLLEPAPSRDHMERLLRAMGVGVESEGLHISISPPRSLHPVDLRIPGDISAAAFWLVAAALHGDARIKVTGCGINPTRSGIIEALQAMGARIHIENRREEGGEPIADLVAESSALSAIHIGGEIIPRLIDEIPVLAVAAAQARGTTIIRDAAELRVKESDRIGTLVEELSKMGAQIEELPDGMVVHGGRRLRGAEVDSHGDHRLAMTLAVAALIAEGETTIGHAEAVAVSYPGFWQDLAKASLHESV
ncbi:MAG TPA: 3-phosphoshikimate 1-carboxyvinyltransferase [Dehalococcoidia bacterium]|nr:3-phosphoshikimate 1-carboxyvinyltransferase [Dehalococcoidia bacterium]